MMGFDEKSISNVYIVKGGGGNLNVSQYVFKLKTRQRHIVGGRCLNNVVIMYGLNKKKLCSRPLYTISTYLNFL